MLVSFMDLLKLKFSMLFVFILLPKFEVATYERLRLEEDFPVLIIDTKMFYFSLDTLAGKTLLLALSAEVL